LIGVPIPRECLHGPIIVAIVTIVNENHM
jgi:hypothetical protein